eukprot:TRINITY_DN67277_c0_g1_i1.p1 TRINITY_DN67277_c0_g1~~TRINITY_DN67277_c0_g1_i1.p1  ORF type:complete len:329 (+),score=97.50 TRINITY_DN67277_c0_g1_i1:21-1007(+)
MAEAPMLTKQELREELLRLKAARQALETEAAEEDASGGVSLNDALLERLHLSSVLQRFRERVPSAEDLAERQLHALEELLSEAMRLKEENSRLAMRAGTGEQAAEAHNASVSSRASRTSRVRLAGEELHDEVCRLRRRHVEHRRRELQSWLKEWKLASCKGEARQVVSEMKQQEKQLQELRTAAATQERSLQEEQKLLERSRRDTEVEQSLIRDLNREVVVTREACLMPARIKRETNFLVKMLDQEGGRLKTRRHLRSLEACKKLYDEVAEHAPSLLPTAGRAKLEMEAQFSRYLQLEEGHNRALQRLHLTITRGLLHERGSDIQSVG